MSAEAIKARNYKQERRLKLVERDLLSVKYELMSKLKWIDFRHVCDLFFNWQ